MRWSGTPSYKAHGDDDAHHSETIAGIRLDENARDIVRKFLCPMVIEILELESSLRAIIRSRGRTRKVKGKGHARKKLTAFFVLKPNNLIEKMRFNPAG